MYAISVVMYGCHNWTIKKAECERIDVFELWCWRRLENPLDSKEIQPVHLEEINSEYSLEGLMLKLKLPIIWPPDAKNWLTGKDPDAGKDWRQEEKGTTEDEMVGWHHWLDGREFEQAPGVGDGQGGLACYSPWGCKDLDTIMNSNNQKSQCGDGMALGPWLNSNRGRQMVPPRGYLQPHPDMWSSVCTRPASPLKLFFQGTSIFWFHGCSHYLQGLWSPRK